MKRRLKILDVALFDLAEARDRYEEQREGLGEKLLDAVDERLEAVVEFPGRSSSRIEVRASACRERSRGAT